MKKGKGNSRRRILSWILAVAVLAAGIPVQAAAFEAVPFADDIFSAGEAGDVFTDTEINVTPSPTETQPEVPVTPSPGETLEPGVTPGPSEPPEPSVTPNPGVTPIPSVTPEPSVTPVPTVTPEPTPTPIVVPDGCVLVRFAKTDGTVYEELDKMLRWGEELEFPDVPGRTANIGNFWKLDKDKDIDHTVYFAYGGDKLMLLKEEYEGTQGIWKDYVKDRILTFYEAKYCKVTLYNNSGTAVYPNGILEAYEGDSVILPDMPGTKYVNFGWTREKGGREVDVKLNESVRILDDTDFYMIRYAALHVNFRKPDGSNSTAFNVLTKTVVKGDTITLPTPPQRTGYSCPGWSRSKDSQKVSYKPGRTITVNGNLTFYAVQIKLPYYLSFNNNKGTSTSKTYTSLKMYAAKDQTVTLPAVPAAAGYQNLGWTTARGKSTPLYKAGAKVKVTRSMRFYAVRRASRYYDVEFFLGNGRTNTAYKRLKLRVEEGTEFTFPLVPARSGYLNKGWSNRMNATKATTRKTYTANKNLKFYAVQVKAVKVILHYVTGEIFSSTTMAQGTSYTLPCVKNAEGYTFMGWSDIANQSKNPKYEPEMRITVNTNTDLYAVVFKKANEPNLSLENLPQMNPYKYKRVVFIGDSRTAYMANVLRNSGVTNGVEFISKVGEGLEWFQRTGYPELYNKVKDEATSILSKKTAVFINLGINDLENQNGYVLYLKSIATELAKHNCELYFVSVNPINRSMLKAAGKRDRSEAKVRVFNNMMRSTLSSGEKPQYKFVDTYAHLKNTGYGFDSSNTGIGGIDDGLHYTARTYKRIYAECMKSLR